MLITINISFCVFSMPIAILQIVYYSDIYGSASESVRSFIANNQSNQNASGFYEYPNNYEDKANDQMLYLLHSIAELLQYLNHGSNFIFYSMSGKTFRNQTKSFFYAKFNSFKSFFFSLLD